jgi:hypothetical protein
MAGRLIVYLKSLPICRRQTTKSRTRKKGGFCERVMYAAGRKVSMRYQLSLYGANNGSVRCTPHYTRPAAETDQRRLVTGDGVQMPDRCSNCIAYGFECSYVEPAKVRQFSLSTGF